MDKTLNCKPRSCSVVLMLTLTLLSVHTILTFESLFFTSPDSNPEPRNFGVARSQSRLKHPVVILVSADGFRLGFQSKTKTPHIDYLINDGTMAENGMIPVFPTLTFPNHYSIVTGLYPAWHGIVNNKFKDPYTNEAFRVQNNEPKWWVGEPLWVTVTKNGLQAATYFWPGSEVVKGPWDCPREFCPLYNKSLPFEDRVDTILGYFDLPSNKIPRFMTLYFEEPDGQGHRFGPDHPEITKAVAHIDKMLGRLMDGLEKRKILDDVTIIMVGDHGMVGTCDKRLVFLEDLTQWINLAWVESNHALLSIRPPAGADPEQVVEKMNKGLSSGKVKNGKYLKVYLKKNLPERFHYSSSDMIPPIIGILEEGYKFANKTDKHQECGGAHGYDNALSSMRTVFFGHGPRFARGRKVPSFEIVEIYNLITSILNISGAPTNGTASFPETVLLS